MDMVICDVVDIDACHLILGRLWQFDVDVQYKVRDNVYVFFKDGQKFVLTPIQKEMLSPIAKEV
jgi:hypothetical protein